MTALPFTLRVETATSPVLFTVQGKLAPPTIEEARIVHNQAAGSDQAIAAARSLGDLSHSVFVRAEPDAPKDDFLIVDYWNSAAGIQMFFSDKQVQEGGAALFREREAVVWAGTPGLPRFALPAPAGRNDRFAGIIRGTVSSQKAAEKVLAEWMGRSVNTARARGLLSREFFFRHAPGGAPSLELIGLDIWFDAEGMQADYAAPAMGELLGALYQGEPDGGVWMKPEGQWVEW